MPTSLRPRRSALYVPGDKSRAIEKARGLPADTVIFDLEDAVAPANKELARRQAIEAVSSRSYGRRECVIRINALASEWGHADLAAVAKSGADAVLLPKIENAAMVREAEAALVAAGAPSELTLWCMIETPRGVLRAEEIADASPRVACLVMGTTDLANDLQAGHTPDRAPLLHALSHCLLAARAAGLACLDGVQLDLEDEAGFERVCRQGMAMGFDGKTLIHPKTVETTNRIYGPSAADIDDARKIVAAYTTAEAAGKGVTVVDGKLVEQLHVSAAQRVIGLAEQIALLVEEAGLAP
ncbi:MAG TPA: CoA ester lyase [Magnetospirillaceae bacterium]|jgi:citrate lyase subunit beta/citryl-CoA lyase